VGVCGPGNGVDKVTLGPWHRSYTNTTARTDGGRSSADDVTPSGCPGEMYTPMPAHTHGATSRWATCRRATWGTAEHGWAEGKGLVGHVVVVAVELA
jgi:hypothetical protein